MIFILKCDGAGCDERVVLDESHVDSGMRLTIPNRPRMVKDWVEVAPQMKQLNGEPRPGMEKHLCPQCAAKGK